MNQVSALSAAALAGKTFVEFGAERLSALGEGVGTLPATSELVALFRRLLRPWGARRIGTVPSYVSNVADDQAPFEFALGISKGAPEIQAYVDPQGDPPTPRSNSSAARALLEAVASERGLSLERFRAIENLFLPEEPGPPFGLWLGASWTPGRDILLKLYLNQQVRGRAASPELVAAAMERLGLERAWRVVEGALSLREGRDELAIVALDLAPSGPTRMKVYIRHHRASVPLILPVTQLTGDFRPQDVSTFYSSLSGYEGPFLDKPIATVFAFREPGSAAPEAVALEFPIGKYVRDDEVARLRIQQCLRSFELPTDAYNRAIHALAVRPLAARAGIHAHVTLRMLSSGPRLGLYFASEAYGNMRWPDQAQASG